MFGVFIAQEPGKTPNQLGGSCFEGYLASASLTNTDINLTGGSGPYYNGELTGGATDLNDTCDGTPVANCAETVTGVTSSTIAKPTGCSVAAGTCSWQATYSGDSFNAGFPAACEVTTISVP